MTTSSGLVSAIAVEDVRQRRLGVEPQIVTDRAQPLGPPPDLVRALLGGDVERRALPRREQLEQQRALADARLAAEQRDRARHDAHRRARGRVRRWRSATGWPSWAPISPIARRAGPVRRQHQHVGGDHPRRLRPACSSRRSPSTAPTTSGATCRTRCTRARAGPCRRRRRSLLLVELVAVFIAMAPS